MESKARVFFVAHLGSRLQVAFLRTKPPSLPSSAAVFPGASLKKTGVSNPNPGTRSADFRPFQGTVRKSQVQQSLVVTIAGVPYIPRHTTNYS